MDHQYAQPEVLMFDKLPVELICRIIVMLNGGTIGDDASLPLCGFLYPGIRGGRELHYFKISVDAMTFWKHVCMYLRHTYSIENQTHDMLFSDNNPLFEDPEYPWEDYRYIPRHLYAGNPEPWMMKLCYGPQTNEEALAEEALAIEAAEEAKIAAKRKRKEKRHVNASVALVAGWDSGERRRRLRK